uniref:Uncharacterized protein n=1 Tax=Panagrolaimus sp. PS1159 TaxID=55785 RepID=A0AC35GT57_9BILA
MTLAITSLTLNWYEIEGNEGKGLFSYRGKTGAEITTLIFLFLGLFTTILELACLIVLIFRVFGFSYGKFANKFLQFQMIFSCWTSFFWYMAIASFWILTPQRTGKHQEDEGGKKIDEVHYDLSFRTKSYLTHVGSGFNYMCIALCLTLFSIFASAILETAVAPRNDEKNLRSNLTSKKFKSF